MRSLLCVALSIAPWACKSETSRDERVAQAVPPVVSADAAPSNDWTVACAEALAAKQTPVRKLSLVIDGCRRCGDWQPILQWSTPADRGGPREEQIADAMEACNAYCSKDAKMQFLGALPDARDGVSNKPWRVLGAKCGDKVSAVPDARFMSAPYFALDRIARAAAADAKLAPLLAAVELPLPPVSITGNGFALPQAAVMKPEPGRFHVTLSQQEIRIGTLPMAKLGAGGVTVDTGATPYPGALVTIAQLRAQLDALVGSPTGRIVVIAPKALPARRVLDVVKAAGPHEVVLAVAAGGAPTGWSLPGIVPIVLDAKPDAKRTAWALDVNVDATIAELEVKPASAFEAPRIVIEKDATVAHLATLLGALAFRQATTASLSHAP